MTWKEEIRKEDKPLYEQKDKMRFIGRITNPERARVNSVEFNNVMFQKILAKGNKRSQGLRLHELEELVKYAENIVKAAPKQLAWLKSELKKHQ